MPAFGSRSPLDSDNKIYIIVIMIRTQISLSKDEYELAKQEAKQQGISLAEFFRRSLRLILPKNSNSPWMKYCGLIESGNPKSSQQIDDVVYGQKD